MRHVAPCMAIKFPSHAESPAGSLVKQKPRAGLGSQQSRFGAGGPRGDFRAGDRATPRKAPGSRDGRPASTADSSSVGNGDAALGRETADAPSSTAAAPLRRDDEAEVDWLVARMQRKRRWVKA